MSDIHVLKGSIVDADRAAYTYLLHVQTGADAALRAKAVLDPAISEAASALGSNILPAELDAIRAGSLAEEQYTISYHKADTPSEYLARIRAIWAERAAALPGEFVRQYQWYLNGYARS